MLSQGAPSRSIVAMAEPSSTAPELPTPWKRNAHVPVWVPLAAMSDSLQPGRIIGAAQARDVLQYPVGRTLPAQLQQRTLQPGQIALAPGGGRDAQAALVEVDQPAFATGRTGRVCIEQDVVRVEVGMVQAGAMEARQQLAGRLPWGAGRIVRGQRGQRTHAGQALEQDRGAIPGAAAPVA